MVKITLILVFSSMVSAFGQVEKKQEIPPYNVALVAVGSTSLAKWTGEGIDQKVAAIDPGAAPPRSIVQKGEGGKGSEVDGEQLGVNLSLNTPTPRRSQRSNMLHLYEVFKGGENPEVKPFASKQMPEGGGDYTVLLARKPGKKDWKNPQLIPMRDGLSAFPKGAVRFSNVAQVPVIIEINGGSEYVLKPGKYAVVKGLLNSEKKPKVRISYFVKKKRYYAMNTTLTQSKELRLNISCGFVPFRPRPTIKSYIFLSEVLEEAQDKLALKQ